MLSVYTYSGMIGKLNELVFLKSSACLLKKQIIINIQDKTSRYIEAVLVELMTYN